MPFGTSLDLNSPNPWGHEKHWADDMENGPDLWDAILIRLPGGVIMGGCVRDFILEKEPKDIDVFINYPDRGRIMRNVEEGLVAWDFIDDHEVIRDRGFYGNVRDLAMVEDYKFGKHKVNVITVFDEDASQSWKTFDLNINMCWYNWDKNCVEVSEEFHKAMLTKEIRINDEAQSRRGLERVLERAKRFTEKFPEFKFVN